MLTFKKVHDFMEILTYRPTHYYSLACWFWWKWLRICLSW